MPLDFDPCDHGDHDDPYPYYRMLRDEAPVYVSPSTGVLCVSRYEDALRVLKDSETFSSSAMRTFLMNGGMAEKPPFNWQAIRMIFGILIRGINPFSLQSGRSLIAEDGAAHSEMRNVVNRGFTPRQIQRWETRAREIVAISMKKLDRGEPFDLVRDLSIPLPVGLICEILGIEVERREEFKGWSDIIVDLATGPGRNNPFRPEVVDAFLGITGYFTRLARRRRKRPENDLISTIVQGRPGETALSTKDAVNFVILLLVAGNETTTNLIGNATLALLDHPDQVERAARDPELVPAIVEEALRYDPPIQLLFRDAVRDTEIAGTKIPKGSIVAPLIGSANRDERRFENPDRFDITRSAQGHLGLGFGSHFCLGSSLARLETRIALEALIPRLGALERANPPGRIDSFLIRGPSKLELETAA